MHTNEPLAGKIVIVTRPLAQAQNMCASLEAYQATVVHFPVINITAAKNIAPAKNVLRQLTTYSTIIFISANAVYYAMQLAQELDLNFNAKRLAAVGPATKAALKNYGLNTSTVPQAGFNSEALLAHKHLQQVAGQKILIIRGTGGREHLSQALQSRGAKVDYAEVYQRQFPKQRNNVDLSKLSNKDTAILVYSAESAQNLWSLCNIDEQQWLTDTTLIAASERIAQTARAAGFAKNSIIAENPSDEAMLNTLLGWAKTSRL